MSTGIPKKDIITLIDLLDKFTDMCKERDVKFNRYTEDQLMAFLQLYKRYRQGEIDPPPFG